MYSAPNVLSVSSALLAVAFQLSVTSLTISYSAAAPESKLTVPSILTKCDYPIETHVVTTADGYVNTLYRIPYGRSTIPQNCTSREPVFIHHGLMSASTDWFCQSCDRNLPLILADSCYDVWLANARGTEFSRGHNRLDSKRDSAYWDFSFDEIGRYDLPAAIDYILGYTHFEKLNYVGHSMGTTVFYVCMHYHPDYNTKVRKMAALAPVAYIGDPGTSVLKLLADIPLHAIEVGCKLIANGEFGPDMAYTLLSQLLPDVICPKDSSYKYFCKETYFFLGGKTSGQCLPLKSSVMNNCFKYFPHPVSCRLVTHYLQLVRTGKFETQFHHDSNSVISANLFKLLGESSSLQSVNIRDYTSVNNVIGSSGWKKGVQPYNLRSTTVSSLLFAGTADTVDTLKDAQKTFDMLGTDDSEKELVVVDGCNHFDLSLATVSKDQVFIRILNFFSSPLLTFSNTSGREYANEIVGGELGEYNAAG